MSRGRLVVAALSVMLAFLSGCFLFLGRAVKREMELARLQSDFVSAVSHEFRTPLAAMRQFSELLADGRVPNERQHYYESLAGESRRLQRLVENILNSAGSRPGQGRSTPSRSISGRSSGSGGGVPIAAVAARV